MQASSLSSNHITSFYKTKLRRFSPTPISPTHLNYTNTKPLSSISSNTLSTTHNNPTNIPISLTRSRPSNAPLLCGNSSNSLTASDGRSFRGWVEVVGEGISTAFPVWVALGCFLGLVRPNSYDWVQPKWTMMGITFTMLGMGMTLTFDDLKQALAMPKELFTGFFLQYSVMPLSAFFISKIMNLPSYYAAGLILVGCCPGGTASNIVTYIARGNVALSVLMTAASTVSAVVMTPFLTANLAGQYVAVDAIGLLKSTLQVVLLPVLVGAFMNQYFKGFVKFVSPLMPPIVVATVVVLCGNAIAQSSSAILMSGQQVVLAAILLHTCGFFFGYVLSRVLGDRVLHWVTFNEPNENSLSGYNKGSSPPGRRSYPFGDCTKGNSSTEPYIVAQNMLLAHASAVSLYHTKYKIFMVHGMNLTLMCLKMS